MPKTFFAPCFFDQILHAFFLAFFSFLPCFRSFRSEIFPKFTSKIFSVRIFQSLTKTASKPYFSSVSAFVVSGLMENLAFVKFSEHCYGRTVLTGHAPHTGGGGGRGRGSRVISLHNCIWVQTSGTPVWGSMHQRAKYSPGTSSGLHCQKPSKQRLATNAQVMPVYPMGQR